MVSKLSTFVSICLAHVIHTFAYLIPRSRTIWVCAGWHNSRERELFADNSKYFFLYLQNNQPDCTSVWLAQDKKLARLLREHGYTSYYIHSLRGMYYALRARYTIVDARITTRYWKFSAGSRIVQLWHGKGMKKSGHDSKYNAAQSYFMNPGYYVKYDAIVATSEKTASLLGKTFSQPMSDMLITGQPRTDIFYQTIAGAEIDEHTGLKDIIESARTKGTERIILYAPTFRADGSNPLDQLTPEKLATLNTTLAERNDLMILSLHPKFAAKAETLASGYSHITSIAPGLDLYPYFKDIDLVITDYSNIYIDFLLLDKKVMFFVFDEEKYRATTGLHPDFDTLTPGPHLKTFEELQEALTQEDTYQSTRSDVQNILFAQRDGNASKRIFTELTK